MKQFKIFGIIAGSLFCLLLVALSLARTDKMPNVAIAFEGRTDSIQREVTLLRLSNLGTVPIRLDPYCALYWTNSFGLSTNCFYEYSFGHSILAPGRHKVVAITTPPEVEVWYSSFGYEVSPNAITRALNQVESLFPWRSFSRQAFMVRLGPVVTNTSRSHQDIK